LCTSLAINPEQLEHTVTDYEIIGGSNLDKPGARISAHTVEFFGDDDAIFDQAHEFRFVDTKIFLFMAIGLGWTFHRHNAYVFMAADGTRMEVPTNAGLNAKVFRSRMNTLMRHRSPNGRGSAMPIALVEYVVELLKIESSKAQVMRKAAIDAPPMVSAPPAAETSVRSDVGKQAEQAPQGTHKRKRRILRQEPWTAHGAPVKGGIGSVTYPSAAVTERTWSDNTTDYRCAWPDCEFTNEAPRSVASHYTSHVRGQGRQPQPEPDGVDIDHEPRKKIRIRNLRRELEGAMTAAFVNGLAVEDPEYPEWVATWIIDHRVEAVRGSDTELSDAGELDTEQILDRIAALVDRGRGHVLREQIATLNDQLDDKEQQVVEANQQVEAANQAKADAESKAQKATDNLHALRDMINEAGES
jgi:hypothetical protein